MVADSSRGLPVSIYATVFAIEDERQVEERLASHGVGYGVIDSQGDVVHLEDLDADMLDAPLVYRGSHVLPHDDDARGGSVSLAAIPAFIAREGRADCPDGEPKPWLRLDIREDRDTHGETQEGFATVVLTRRQAERMRGALTAWLDDPEAFTTDA